MKKNVLLLLPFLIGIVGASLVIRSFSKQTIKFEDAALGEETSSYFAVADGFPIHNSGYSKRNDSLLLAGWKIRSQKPVVFFIGNSQTHGVNHLKSGDVNYIEMLYQSNAASGFDILANSVPNANLQEFHLLYAHYAELLPINTLFFPVFMDDLRETDIRAFFFDEMRQVPISIFQDSSAIAHKITQQVTAFQQSKSATGDMAALDQTMQALVEERLNIYLNAHWLAWKNRDQMRGTVFNSLYQWRNTAFGITAQTRRKMVPATYQDNLSALEALLRLAHKNKTRVVVYVPPLRNDVTPPYEAAEYAEFKQKLESITRQNGASFANVENTVPGPQWGMKGSTNTSGQPEYDFMHFTVEGHRLLGEALRPFLPQAPTK